MQDERIKSMCRKNGGKFRSQPLGRHRTYYKCFRKNFRYSFLALAPILYEVRSFSPLRVLVHEILSQKEIRALENKFRHRLTFERALPLLSSITSPDNYTANIARFPTIYTNEFLYEKYNANISRISNNKYLVKEGDMQYKRPQTTYKNLLMDISKRIQAFTGLNVSSSSQAGAFRISWYGLGGWAGVHNDMYGVSEGKYVNAHHKNHHKNGDFIASILIWVNQAKLGGSTFFPSMEKSDDFHPIKGSALLWVSGKASGAKDITQYHGGCPIGEGSKFVIGKWIRHFDHWKTIPCGQYLDADVTLDIIPSFYK